MNETIQTVAFDIGFGVVPLDFIRAMANNSCTSAVLLSGILLYVGISVCLFSH